MEKLIEKGFANLNTMVHQKKLRKAIYEFWGGRSFTNASKPNDCNKDCHWLNSLVRDNKITSQPIRHLLVARALGLKTIDLLDNQSYINIEKDHKEQWRIN